MLIVTGLLMFGFVAYQLWGTGIQYAQAQDRLDQELEDFLAQAPTTSAAPTAATAATTTTSTTSTTSTTIAGATAPSSTSSTTSTSSTSTTVAAAEVPDIEIGDAIARISIPSIGLDAVVVAGVDPGDLREGPGHYPGTPMPGQLGNSAIAGHRTTYGQPFFDLDELEPGDEIVLTTVQGQFIYRVTGSEIVPPSRGDVVLTTDPSVARLTLTTCDPVYTATNRLIVRADLDSSAAVPLPADLDYGAGVAATTVRAPASETLPGEAGSTPAPTTVVAPATVPAGTGTDPAASVTTAGVTNASVNTAEGSPTTVPGTSSTDVLGTLPGEAAADTAAAGVPDAFAQGWFSDDGAYAQVAGWAAACAAVAVGGYLVARALRRRWLGWVVAAVPFVVALYFFYENVNRLLPAAI